ncbi:MAG: Ser-Thr-rich GPI-anchored membrane family protein [Patescibacteria group bacterium]
MARLRWYMKKTLFSLLVLVPLLITNAQSNNFSLSVTAPNGGETLVAGQKATISWKAQIGYYEEKDLYVQRGGFSPNSSQSLLAPYFLYAPVNIYLVRQSDPSYIYNIATINLYDSRYAWVVPTSIPNGIDYKIRISANGASDDSNSTFSIQSSVCYLSREVVQKMRERLQQMESTMAQLQAQMNQLRAALNEL